MKNRNDNLKAVVNALMVKHKVSTQDELSKKIKVAYTYLSELLSGKKPISDLFIRKLAKNQGINIDYLMEGKGPIFQSQVNYDDEVEKYSRISIVEDDDLKIKYYELLGEHKQSENIIALLREDVKYYRAVLEIKQREFQDVMDLLKQCRAEKANYKMKA